MVLAHGLAEVPIPGICGDPSCQVLTLGDLKVNQSALPKPQPKTPYRPRNPKSAVQATAARFGMLIAVAWPELTKLLWGLKLQILVVRC